VFADSSWHVWVHSFFSCRCAILEIIDQKVSVLPGPATDWWPQPFFMCSTYVVMHDHDQLLGLQLQSKCSLSDIVRHQVWSAGLESVTAHSWWWPSFRCRWCSTMEQFASRHCRMQHTVTVLLWTENISDYTVALLSVVFT